MNENIMQRTTNAATLGSSPSHHVYPKVPAHTIMHTKQTASNSAPLAGRQTVSFVESDRTFTKITSMSISKAVGKCT
jgi:hypothetical protein